MDIDLYKALTTNPLFVRRLDKAFTAVKQAEMDVRQGKYGAEGKLDIRITELLELCHWNLGVLVPLYFPTFIDGSPLNPMRRPHSFMMLSLFTYGYTAVRGSRQIGKSTKLIARQLIKAMIFARHHSIYVCPHAEHKKTYANRFREMEMDCPYIKNQVAAGGMKLRNNLFFKEYSNQSNTYIVNALTDTSQARSKTADELMYDEYQLFDIDLEPDIEQCQSVSKTPMTLYAGTSTTIDSPLEYRYQQGSQAHWVVKSPNGKDWLDFGDADMMLKMIKPEGLRCPFSGREFDVTEGFYEHMFPSRLEYGHVSVHVPQLIIPDNVTELTEWNKIYKAFSEYDRKKFMEEILGIPTEEGSSEISAKDLENIAILPTREDIFEKQVRKGYYKFLVSGCDWGGSDHIKEKKDKLSYTVHAILGVTPDDKIDIVHIKQYTGMDFSRTAADIVADHKKYGAMAMAGDSGMGQAYNTLMEKGLGDCPHYSMSYSGNVGDLMKSPKHGAPNQIILNRSDSVSQLFMDIKTGSDLIRCYSWSESQPRLLEFLNLKRVLIDGPNGSSKFYYSRRPTHVDDSLHAVNFAYVLTKVLMGRSIINDTHLKERVMASVLQQSGNYEDSVGFGFGDIVSG
jgi:hypothetical protein